MSHRSAVVTMSSVVAGPLKGRCVPRQRCAVSWNAKISHDDRGIPCRRRAWEARTKSTTSDAGRMGETKAQRGEARQCGDPLSQGDEAGVAPALARNVGACEGGGEGREGDRDKHERRERQ
jgi:hypothetical protein